MTPGVREWARNANNLRVKVKVKLQKVKVKTFYVRLMEDHMGDEDLFKLWQL